MKQSQKEKDTIFCAQLQANAPITGLKKLTGYRDHSIRYFLQRALDQGFIVRRCFINLNLIGCSQYEIYFSLSSEKKESRNRLIKTLIQSEKISWLGKLGGDYQYGINICAKSIREVSDFLDSLSAKFGAIFLEKVIAVRISLSYFGNKYLSNKKRPDSCLSYHASLGRIPIDEIDHKILTKITETGDNSSRQLSRILGIPQTTLDYRIKKLEQQKIIVGYYYELQAAKLGMQTFMLLVCVKGFSSKFREIFFQFCKQHPKVVILIHSIGNWDFEVVVEVKDSVETTVLTEEIYDKFGAYLNWVKILPSFGYPKVMEYPFQDYKSVEAIQAL
jgi:Lrp/AsnC family transcriptional regulator, leucine-responsive regulatory protein